MTSLLPEIARRLSLRTTFSEIAMERARDAVIDTLGCMIAGAGNHAAERVDDSIACALHRGLGKCGSQGKAARDFGKKAGH